jgi:hypothetical protein
VQSQTAELVADGKGIERAANELLEHMQEQRAHSAELFARALQALEDLERAAREREEALAEQGEDTARGIEESLERLGSAHGELATEVEGARSELEELRQELDQAASSARSSAAECGDAVAEVDRAADRGRDELSDALDAAESHVEALREAVRSAQEAVKQGTAALREQMRGLLEQGRREVENTEQTLRTSLGGLQSHLAEEKGRLEQGTQDLLEALRQRVDAEVKARIAEAVDAVLGGLSQLGQTLAAAEADAHREGEEVEAWVQDLGEAMEPFPAAIESVREAARQVNLPWA